MTWPSGASRTSTAAHKAWARAVLRASGGRCAIAGPRCAGRATIADHITPVAEGGAEHDVANGQGACKPCHDDKTAVEAARGRRRYYGAARRPPARHPGLLLTPGHHLPPGGLLGLRSALWLAFRAMRRDPFFGVPG